MSGQSPGAVFLSYASQDAEAARRICEALRSVGIEAWLDQSELVGGAAWDAEIRRRINECLLFVPLISVHTEQRREGYFRLEWRLADQRTHRMAKGTPFVVPVVIDGTSEAQAHVPDSFLDVQWTRLQGGEGAAALARGIGKLLATVDVQTATLGIRCLRQSVGCGIRRTRPCARPTGSRRWSASSASSTTGAPAAGRSSASRSGRTISPAAEVVRQSQVSFSAVNSSPTTATIIVPSRTIVLSRLTSMSF